MDERDEGHEWAVEEFSAARLGDARRVKRLVVMAKGAMNRPAGQVTAVYSELAEREGAFRLIENAAVSHEEIARAAHRACAKRAAVDDFAFVGVDGTSLNITDTRKKKGLGIVGTRYVGASGVQVMTAFAVSPTGVPLGLCGQKYWARIKRSSRKSKDKHDSRPLEAKETYKWIEVMNQVRGAFSEEAPRTKPWFQLDRGGDAWPIILDGLREGELFTVRAEYDRRLTKETKDEPRRHLRERLETCAILGHKMLVIPAKPGIRTSQGKKRPPRHARTADIELRACELSLDMVVDTRTRKSIASPKLYALLARETTKSAGGETPIEWMLLTSYPVHDEKSAELVLFGYAQRWRIEEFHKSWKSGACKVEDTQLRDLDHILRWATVLASVAARILRMSYLAREEPGLSSLQEFSRAEVDAIVVASKSKKHHPGTTPPLGTLVELLGRVGGYIGRSSGGPPGALVLARGLLTIEALALALESGLVELSRGKRRSDQ